MPVSKRRKKNGKVVKPASYKRDIPDDRPIGVSLQDLINVVAYQEYVNNGTIVTNDAKVNTPDEACFDCRKYDCNGECVTILEEENKDGR